MFILEELKKNNVKPDGLLKNSPSIKQFVREHLDQLIAIREKGYSWKQIAAVVQDRMHFHTRDITQALESAFSKAKMKA